MQFLSLSYRGKETFRELNNMNFNKYIFFIVLILFVTLFQIFNLNYFTC